MWAESFAAALVQVRPAALCLALSRLSPPLPLCLFYYLIKKAVRTPKKDIWCSTYKLNQLCGTRSVLCLLGMQMIRHADVIGLNSKKGS